MEKVKIMKEWLKTAQSRQKSYSDVRRRDLEFKEDDWKEREIESRYAGPYRIIQRIGHVSYKLELPPEMSLVHPVFHVSMLKKVIRDPSLIVPVETIEVNEELSYEGISVAILDKQVEEATLEAEEEMKKKYPDLFE
ncbi:PREDICTED: uncharacterized protein LOC109220930 [Nicotiana attenuata]|uniref:uncharacterized protein LOC109220930 n=1 Tax=Nicotiana attenuata TaxID=49451 RepID=UPI00090463A1|nr:PREDICTED: uncharacterized protein LOC109220930 [Nicotiana attenuata]